MDNLPLISIVVLCRNEEGFIAECLDSLLASDYPKDRLEVLVSDGMSEDGTREIVESYSKKYPCVKLIDNPKKIPATAANQGVRAAKGELVMIAGAHARYAKDYVSKCVAYSQAYPAADNIGGVRWTEPRSHTFIGKTIAYVTSHRFGAGTAPYHRGGNSPAWVDSVWGGCYRREVFDRLGLYNESLVVGEDREFNRRLRGLGGKILQVPEIKCTYYARGNFREFCRWAFRMGFWPFYAEKLVESRILSFRNFAPLALIGSLLLCLGISFRIPLAWFSFFGILSAYLLVTVASSVDLARRERDLRYLFLTPFIFGVTHAFYGGGSIYGVFKPTPPRRTDIR
ncbi:MAG: glycosyltransferase family 2 protein [Candidatus Acidiferrales bacterium]|jgi:glycosyltransferase involved in cell wall biosynthesis